MVSAAETANGAAGICQGPFAARMRHLLGEVSVEMVIHVVLVSAVYRMQFMWFFSQAETEIKQEMIAFGRSREGSRKLANSFHTMHEREACSPFVFRRAL